MAVFVNTNSKKGSITTMGFVVHLKEGPALVKVDADTYLIEDGVYHFTKTITGNVASFPVSNVLAVVKEQS